ncbi:hypothetical protein NBO_26g0001 [Nosema bombycis CQ1]|uniref:Uncharacterized protein n=1 Tax=Nosema bombycis (strain CQ1 / CVCC 102059) TaxID=578461 RepID=R0KUJ2_NOSB1|nr:hypothetical protein NBO_26g0001 [Nosema bombycis CQ1]|eukprot:EOB14516.1 hypothetical protein NBO_26g0001 [Nosema bombycis CQ1]
MEYSKDVWYIKLIYKNHTRSNFATSDCSCLYPMCQMHACLQNVFCTRTP